ncbi:hypothetical protein POM88_025299 [Heracleum sosnowskyi]|uniref:BED-type domain-containing protein n=1 Tax=Heracleum sosnowskyi TaxID=360622 RepID=A0AAD8MJP1_9APIA|nr:hypothetical protein POM88_025299 [Heracleum sosnowskyi]
MAEEHPESNIPIYESLSEEDEADIRENENANTKPSTEGSVKPVKEEKPQKEKGKGTKRKWSKVWDTFAYIKGTSEEGDTAKCQKCGYTIPYNSSFGTGNLLKHQKTCTRSSDIRQMIISSSGGSIAMHSAKFDPMVFRDMITDAVAEITFQNQGLDVMKEFDALDCDQVYHNYPLEELTQDIMKVDIMDHPDQDG